MIGSNRFVVLIVCVFNWAVLSAQETTELDTIVVEGSADETSEPEAELPHGLGISGDTLTSIPGSGGDPLRGLQSLPGMTFTDDQGADPAVRGSRPGDNYYEADFLPVGYLFHSGGVISVFNSDLIESFYIYPSVHGAEYSGLTGAVVDIRLREPKQDRLHFSLDASFLQTGALLEGPVNEKQSFYLAGRMSYLDLFVEDQLDDEDGIEYEQFPKYTDYQGKYLYTPDSTSSLTFQVSGATDDHEIVVAEDSEEIETDPIFAGRHFEQQSFNTQGLVWRKAVTNRLNLDSALSHSTSAGKSEFGGAGFSDYELEQWLFKSHATITASEQHDITVGANLSQTDIDFEVAFNDPKCTEFEPECTFTNAERVTTTQKQKIESTHLFLKDTWYLNDRLTLYPGVVMHSENFLDKSFIEPRFSVDYKLDEDTVLSTGVGHYHQIPDYFYIDEEFGNPDLDYIESKNFVFGLKKQFEQGWSISSEIYYKQLENLVVADEQTVYSNAGEGYAYGIDLLLRKNMGEKLSGWLSVSLSEAKRKNTVTGKRFVFEYDQPVNATAVLTYDFSPRWTLGAKLWLHSGSPYTKVIGAQEDENIAGLYIPEYGPLNGERTPFYHRMDIRLDRELKTTGRFNLSAYLEVLNLLDIKNISGYDYNNDYTERTGVSQFPRIVAIGIKANF